MKRSCVRFWIPLFLPLLFIVHFTDAVESDPKEATTLVSKNEDGTNLKLAYPVIDNAEEEKKVKEETKEATEKEESKETRIKKKKDEPLEEPEPEVKNETERSNGDSHVEGCDPANRCVDDKSKFVACLRVPGKDSLDLSLLIQNKGKGSLDVNIVAPDFVSLDQNAVRLKAKEKKEIKVSVADGGNDTMIVLKAGEGSCQLNFQNMVSDSVKKSETTTALPGYFNCLSVHSSFILVILAAAVLIGLAWSFIKFQRLKSQEGGPKYQQLDVGLPVSTGGNKDVNESEGWDNSWGNDWDDEEAPMTPSKPVLTPSARGLASRKFSKDSWKD